MGGISKTVYDEPVLPPTDPELPEVEIDEPELDEAEEVEEDAVEVDGEQ